MTTEGFKRKLTAVFSADVVEYSRLMGADESATVKTLETYKGIMFSLIKQHRGRVVDSPGDNLLAEFGSVVDAVQCAVAIQKELQARNSDLPEDRRMQFRIGINLGDVIEEKERIYGDGVNIAARLEALAEPGGICVSKTAFDHIESKLPLGYQFLGEQTVKNIAKPVGAYKVLLEPRVIDADEKEEAKKIPFWRRRVVMTVGILVLLIIVGLGTWNFYFRAPSMEPVSEERMAFPLPEKPSIAVLPFANMSGDPAQDYIGEGLSENIISALSKISKMFVIARNSSFSYKGKSVKVQKVAEELGVQYVLEGSVQKSGDRLRVTAQLIDALSGHHLWSEKYDREMRELFDLQDEITKKIVVELQVELTYGEMARVYARDTENMEAWSHLVRGIKHSWRINKKDLLKGRELIEKAINLDPRYVAAWAWLGNTYMLELRGGLSKSPAESVKRAYEAYQKALTLDENHPFGHAGMVAIYLVRRQHDKAIAEGERAISLDPNYASGHWLLGVALRFAGRFDEAIDMIDKAMRLNPGYPIPYLRAAAECYADAGRYEEAIAAFNQLDERCRKGECPPFWGTIGLARTYAKMGKDEEARDYVAQALKIRPGLSLEKLDKPPYKDPAHLQRYVESLRKAGLPEKPPLPVPDKPSIAVLPFVNMSGDPDQEYFSDGISEEIITALSKVPGLFVIARNSSFSYKGKAVKVQQVGRDLGVRYVLEGSVRKAENQVRITAQLVNCKTGHHLWAERYDRELKDIFALQDEITMKILDAMRLKITTGERARSMSKGAKNLKAVLKAMESSYYRKLMNFDDRIRAKKLLEEAIVLDPEYPTPYAGLGICHVLDVMTGTTKNPKESMIEASKLAQKALNMDETLPSVHYLLGFIYFAAGQWEKAIPALERALELNPNESICLFLFARSLAALGKPQEAIPLFHRALRVDPLNPSFPYWGLGATNVEMERYEEAINYFRKSLESNPKNTPVLAQLAFCYVALEREEEARGVAVEILKLNPKFSVKKLVERYPSRDQVLKERMQAALLKVGLSE